MILVEVYVFFLLVLNISLQLLIVLIQLCYSHLILLVCFRMIPLIVSLFFQVYLSVVNTYVICHIYAFFKVIISWILQIVLLISFIYWPMSKRGLPVLFSILFFLDFFQNFQILLYYLVIRVIRILFLHLHRYISHWTLLAFFTLRNLHFDIWGFFCEDHIYDFVGGARVVLDHFGLRF